MRMLEAFAEAFIQTFGITKPTAAARRHASWFIFVLLVLTVAGAGAVGYAFYAALHR